MNQGLAGRRLPASFYRREDVVAIAQELLGMYLVSDLEGGRAAGRIVETEAYRGPDDRACHAHCNRFTNRTRVMFEAGGVAYVYLCYGIHHLFNVVTGPPGYAHAVLIRAVEPVEGLGLMLRRRGHEQLRPQLTAGPGVLTRALGISTRHNGRSLVGAGSPIWIEDRGQAVPPAETVATTRIGVDYAGECAAWPWRFYHLGSKFVSKR